MYMGRPLHKPNVVGGGNKDVSDSTSCLEGKRNADSVREQRFIGTV